MVLTSPTNVLHPSRTAQAADKVEGGWGRGFKGTTLPSPTHEGAGIDLSLKRHSSREGKKSMSHYTTEGRGSGRGVPYRFRKKCSEGESTAFTDGLTSCCPGRGRRRTGVHREAWIRQTPVSRGVAAGPSSPVPTGRTQHTLSCQPLHGQPQSAPVSFAPITVRTTAVDCFSN